MRPMIKGSIHAHRTTPRGRQLANRLANSTADFEKASCSVVCPAKAGVFSRGQTCRGRSQSPVAWIAEEMETEPSKPIDKISLGEVASHRAVSKENALWPRK